MRDCWPPQAVAEQVPQSPQHDHTNHTKTNKQTNKQKQKQKQKTMRVRNSNGMKHLLSIPSDKF